MIFSFCFYFFAPILPSFLTDNLFHPNHPDDLFHRYSISLKSFFPKESRENLKKRKKSYFLICRISANADKSTKTINPILIQRGDTASLL